MSGNDKLLVDTNLFIFLVNGNRNAEKALEDKLLFFSFISEIELLGKFSMKVAEQVVMEDVLSFCSKLTYNDAIGKKAIELKQRKKIKLPDAIIAATAIIHDLPLLTADRSFASIPDLRCIVFEV